MPTVEPSPGRVPAVPAGDYFFGKDGDKRYLGIMLRGIATRPDEEPPLPVPALDFDRAELVMFNAKRPRNS